MGSIAYLRYMIDKGVRITQGAADKMLDRGVKGGFIQITGIVQPAEITVILYFDI